MSTTCTSPSAETDSTTSPAQEGPNSTNRNGILLAHPSSIGYAVELPPVEDNPQAAVDAIYANTPFVPHLRSADEPTTFESVDEFLQQHPEGEAMRPVLEQHFDYTG
jgi:hypothetical protein